jgi:hypothetical protein
MIVKLISPFGQFGLWAPSRCINTSRVCICIHPSYGSNNRFQSSVDQTFSFYGTVQSSLFLLPRLGRSSVGINSAS